MRAVVIVSAIVLAAVGLGTWFVAGLPGHEYGPAGEQFLVAFPRPPFVRSLPGDLDEYGTNRGVIPGSQPSGQERARYRYVAVGTISEFAADPAFNGPTPFLDELRRFHFHDVGGFEVTPSSLTCKLAWCAARMTVRHGGVVWSISAGGERRDVARFVSSFVPIG